VKPTNRLPSANSKKPKKATLLGLAFDNEDGHTRLTRGPNFVLAGGSQETHSVMQETVIKVNEKLDRKGKRLEDVSPKDLHEMFREVLE